MLRTKHQPTMATVKSRLAQLLATENIKVQHLPVKTAYMDMKNRVLVCPIWKDMDGDLYDLCMGHEVGHALNTPAEGWHGALVQMGKGYQTYMNVVEDARIERKMKTKFPGLRAPFARAYIKLNERDMFRIRERNININKLGLIDRLNVHFKMGHIFDVHFTDEERTYIDRINSADTWEQVREIADELYARAKKRKDMLPQMPQNGMPQEGDESQEGEDSEQSNPGKKPKKGKKEKKQDKDQKSKKDKPKKQKKNKEDLTDEELAEDLDSAGDQSRPEDDENEYEDDGGGSTEGDDSDEEGDTVESGDEGIDSDSDGDGEDEFDENQDEVEAGQDNHSPDDDDQAGSNVGDRIYDGSDEQPEIPDPTSLTDEAFRSAEEQLVDKSATGIRVCYLPDTDNVKKMITPIELAYKSIEQGVQDAFDAWERSYGLGQTTPTHTLEEFSQMSVQEILADNKKYVDLLVKEFELRKNASDYARQLTAKTGELDVNRLHQYRFTNNLFRKITIVQKGKNHGMVFFLDMSSSMSGIMGYTVKQLLVLVMFCKRVGIPFDVYGFADGVCHKFHAPPFKWEQDTIQCRDRNFHLKYLISSNLRGKEFRRAFGALAMYSNIFYGQTSKAISKYLTAGQPVVFSESDMNMVLNGTPFNKMLLASREIIQQFRLKHNVDIVNVIHLTDGDGTDSCHAPELSVDHRDPTYQDLVNARIAYTDRKTHISHMAEIYQSSQEILTAMVKEITGCRHIAFYVGESASTIRGYLSRIKVDDEKNVAKESLKKNGFFRVTHLGYDSYYYMTVHGDGNTKISDNTNVDIADRFIDAQREKAKSRNMARSFASEIAEQVKRE